MSVSKSSKKINVKKPRKVVVQSLADVHIKASFNNTIISFCNHLGDVFAWSTSGKMGFKGAKKSTPYASTCSAEDSARVALGLGVKKVNVFVSGPGLGRESAIRAIQAAGIEVESITDVTPVPYNGCRPPKRRRP